MGNQSATTTAAATAISYSDSQRRLKRQQQHRPQMSLTSQITTPPLRCDNPLQRSTSDRCRLAHRQRNAKIHTNHPLLPIYSSNNNTTTFSISSTSIILSNIISAMLKTPTMAMTNFRLNSKRTLPSKVPIENNVCPTLTDVLNLILQPPAHKKVLLKRMVCPPGFVVPLCVNQTNLFYKYRSC